MNRNKNATFAAISLLLLFTATLAGLLWSRALLSVVHIIWVVAILVILIKSKFVTNSPLFTWSIVPLLLFLFGLYQQPLATTNYDYLLTLLMYPVAAVGTSVLFNYVPKNKCLKLWMIIALISLLLPVKGYFFNLSGVYLLYAQAKTLSVWMSGDHVRYGLFLSASFLFLLSYDFFKTATRILLLCILFLIIVLISIRTAWVAAIIIIMISGWKKIKDSKYTRGRWLIPLLIMLFSIAAYEFVDSVKGKVDYMIYDWQSFDKEKYNPDFSDGTRRKINYTAWKTITTENNGNVGWAAIPPTLQDAFAINFPQQEIKYGWPFNQWLFWWMGAGWWTAILFSLWLLYPVVYAIKNKNHALCSWTLVITASCLVESTLTLQYGVFLHAWVTAFLWVPGVKAEPGSS